MHLTEQDIKELHTFVTHHEAPVPDFLFEMELVGHKDLDNPEHRRQLATEAHRILLKEHLDLQAAYSALQQKAERLSELDRVLGYQSQQRTLAALLAHVGSQTCLSGHPSFDLDHLAQQLGADVLQLHDAVRQAWEDGLMQKEQRWTGSWKRIRLTSKGQRFLSNLPN
ncbi:hypothetical protein Deipr_2400 (plasmid) [Deinococcus proteolyticus MRP]|uniref:Uncharacterized protein n=1 Tax=Deinococcus proteolyticus (strain ATCC 35074 / DSM 20540 / JCM 6276 / NBRC 101906 / NCIMB 13154 / VKM Ac-1939 / CCM 2703 / MRP) TaxID=693977 RepID=F0RQG5_DEIPM|nr:hypothetical protein [Deinococcus proteolyticus]ADY27524.1 hypothetical protein Deipr_2400 [Deinococcus proteolyticus MRP]